MSQRLERLAGLVQCPRCRSTRWSTSGNDVDGALVCQSCQFSGSWRDGVLDLGTIGESAGVAQERAAVRATEQNAALGGINDEFEDLARAEGQLRDAIVALPYGNDSKYYREPGYFANVQRSVPAFDFLIANLGLQPGQRLLDLGADLTWSTAQMARRGLECCAVDINHHLSVARLFEARYGISYHCVRASMSEAPFRPRTFDVVLAMNALHHAERLDDVAASIGRVLKRGGRLAFVEPYCATEDAKAAFGREQIDAGISEQTYLLPEWHRAFVNAGLRCRVYRVSDSFSAVYEKALFRSRNLFAHFYDATLAVVSAPAEVAAGSSFDVVVAVDNRSNAVWTSQSQFAVAASYHLHRRTDGRTALLSFDNPRTNLSPEIGPGQSRTMSVNLTAPVEPGDYVADIDLVHEGVTWFAQKGVKSPSVPFRVHAPDRAPAATRPS